MLWCFLPKGHPPFPCPTETAHTLWLPNTSLHNVAYSATHFALFQDQITQLLMVFTAQETFPKLPGLIYFMVSEMSPAIDSFG